MAVQSLISVNFAFIWSPTYVLHAIWLIYERMPAYIVSPSTSTLFIHVFSYPLRHLLVTSKSKILLPSIIKHELRSSSNPSKAHAKILQKLSYLSQMRLHYGSSSLLTKIRSASAPPRSICLPRIFQKKKAFPFYSPFRILYRSNLIKL